LIGAIVLTHARKKPIIQVLPPFFTRVTRAGRKQKVPSFDNHRFHCNGEAMTPPGQCDRPRLARGSRWRESLKCRPGRNAAADNLISACDSAREGQAYVISHRNCRTHRSLRKAEAEPRSCLNAPGLVVRLYVLANLVKMVMIFSIGAALTNVFGRMVNSQRQGSALFGVMGSLWLVGVIIAYSFKDSQ